MNVAERRSARLLFAPELEAGTLDDPALEHPAVRDAVVDRQVPSAPARAYQRVAMKRGRLSYDSAGVGPFVAARRAVLGEGAAGPPRFLVRMDEYPHYESFDDPERRGDAAFAPWRDIMTAAGCDHLIAVLPALAHDPLDPEATGGREIDEQEGARLEQLRRDGITLGLHGYDHRTRDAHPRRHSEVAGLSREHLAARLDRGEQVLLERAAIRPRVFVPPYNRFDAEQYAVLAGRYDVVCGGPESVMRMGFHPTPLWRGDAVFLPAYAPLYGTAAEVLPAVERYLEARTALWMPIVLHWGWEADRGWDDLRRLAERLAPYAHSWGDFLDHVHASR